MIAIIKYNAGNIRSVENALNSLGYDCAVTDNPERIESAEKVIFPGVGEAASAMRHIKKAGLDELIKSLKQPVLGICLGQQLMCKFTEEGKVEGLGIFETTVKRFPPEERVPHMGWNNLRSLEGSLFNGIDDNDDVYFVHSYFAELCDETTAVCDYILPFSAALQKNNFYATQFHPEKSADVGHTVLRNFLGL
ncbi:MAG TPA: imidazole glycerol phosphate synthase subunit HisH [Balneolaceae bacterium]